MPAERESRKVCVKLSAEFLRELDKYPGKQTWKIDMLVQYAIALGALSTARLPRSRKPSRQEQCYNATVKRWDAAKSEIVVKPKVKVHLPLEDKTLEDLWRYEGEQSEKIETLCRFALEHGALMPLSEALKKGEALKKAAERQRLTQPMVFEGL